MITKKINFILHIFFLSLVVVSFIPFGNKSKPWEVSSSCKQGFLYEPYHIIKSIVAVISQLFLAVLSVLSFPKHNKEQLVLVCTHYLHRFSNGKSLIHFTVHEICQLIKFLFLSVMLFFFTSYLVLCKFIARGWGRFSPGARKYRRYKPSWMSHDIIHVSRCLYLIPFKALKHLDAFQSRHGGSSS